MRSVAATENKNGEFKALFTEILLEGHKFNMFFINFIASGSIPQRKEERDMGLNAGNVILP